MANTPQCFRAALNVPSAHHGRTVTERVVCRRVTRHIPGPDTRIDDSKKLYREFLLERLKAGDPGSKNGAQPALDTPSTAMIDNDIIMEDSCDALFGENTDMGTDSIPNSLDELIVKFLELATILENAKAVAFSDIIISQSLIDAHSITLPPDDSNTDHEASISKYAQLLNPEPEFAQCIHPLFILLLAYRLGGPINASYTAYTHKWKPPQHSASAKPSDLILTEGDTKDFMTNHRLTFAWEMRNDTAMKPSGDHNIFPSGTVELTKMAYIREQEENADEGPVAILYDAKNSACCYSSPDPDVVRDSVSFNFQVPGLSNLLSSLWWQDNADRALGSMTLTQLLTVFPVCDYASHFHDALFKPQSISTILSKLAKLKLPPVPPPTSTTLSHKQKYRVWENDNQANIPTAVRDSPMPLLTGLYPTMEPFLENLARIAAKSTHISLGVDMCPLECETLESETKSGGEEARKFMRDLNERDIRRVFTPFIGFFQAKPPKTSDLLPVHTLSGMALRLSKMSLDLSTLESIDPASKRARIILSVSSFTSAIGTALSSPLETTVNPEPWIDDFDLQIFGTRCLYLFYCAQNLTGWLWQFEKECERTGMHEKEKTVGRERREAVWTANMLVRNWVAWVLFVEGLPQRPFRVRL
jgi:hypothetical protein